MRTLIALTCLLSAVGCVAHKEQAQPAEPAATDQPGVARRASLEDVPRRIPEPYTGPDESRQLIEKLRELDEPVPGLAAMMSGLGFAPLGHVRNAGAMILTDHRLTASDSVTRLVQLGPKAVPALLEHLDDARPTKYRAGGGVIMWMMSEPWLACPSDNAAETEIIEAAKRAGKWGEQDDRFVQNLPVEEEAHKPFYRVTVGDACFTILGQITNRYYMATYYQPSSGMCVCSPILHPELAAAVRKIWATPDIEAHLKANWLAELASREPYGHYREGAAMRLLFYFGEECVPAIIRRIDTYLDTTVEAVADSRLCEAVTFCDSPALLDRLVQLFRDTGDEELASACLPAVLKRQPALAAAMLDSIESPDDSRVRAPGLAVTLERRRLVEACMGQTQAEVRAALGRLMRNARDEMEFVACADPAAEFAREGLVAKARHFLSAKQLESPRPMSPVLAAVVRTLPEECPAMLDAWLESGHEVHQAALALALGEQHHALWRKWIRPMLGNTRNAAYGTRQAEYKQGTSFRSHPEPVRVCDLAAWAASHRDPKLKFNFEGSRASLDEQIERIAQALDK